MRIALGRSEWLEQRAVHRREAVLGGRPKRDLERGRNTREDAAREGAAELSLFFGGWVWRGHGRVPAREEGVSRGADEREEGRRGEEVVGVAGGGGRAKERVEGEGRERRDVV